MFILSIYYHLLYLNYTSIKLKKMWEFVWGSCLIKAPAWEKIKLNYALPSWPDEGCWAERWGQELRDE